MIKLDNPNISYTIISSTRLDDMISTLYIKGYGLTHIKEYHNDKLSDSILTYADVNNDILRNDTISLLNEFNENYAIIKYNGETEIKKIFKDGSEKLLSVLMYNTNNENKSYILNGLSFSFTEAKRYWKPTKKEDFKVGMVVEYFNNNKWNEKIVVDINSEYDNFYKLLIKYDKVRSISI